MGREMNYIGARGSRPWTLLLDKVRHNMEAVFLDFETVASPGLDLAALEAVTPDLEIFERTPAAEVAARIAGCSFVYLNKVRMTREIMEASPELRFIGLVATGVDNVDLEAARERGIAVANIRSYCTGAVVEHVFGVILTLAHSLHRYRDDVRAGAWQQSTSFCLLQHPIRELAAMTLGIVGHGELGQAVETMARAFGMDVRISERPGSTDPATDGRMPFHKLLRVADVLSLHCPLTDNTRGLIGRGELALMKPDAILVNTARGGLVDSAALADALENGRIGGAAIDVLATEPPVAGDPLLDYRGDNLILTPHIAWATLEARRNAIRELAANVQAFLDGRPRNRVA